MKRQRYDRRYPGTSISRADWEALCLKYGNRCLWCGEQKPLTADHVIPRLAGGEHVIENIQPLCKRCNSRKKLSVFDLRDTPFPGLDWEPPAADPELVALSERLRLESRLSPGEKRGHTARHVRLTIPIPKEQHNTTTVRIEKLTEDEQDAIARLTPKERTAALAAAGHEKIRRIARRLDELEGREKRRHNDG